MIKIEQSSEACQSIGAEEREGVGRAKYLIFAPSFLFLCFISAVFAVNISNTNKEMLKISKSGCADLHSVIAHYHYK